MENSDAPGVRGEPGGHRASGRGRDSPDAHFFFANAKHLSSKHAVQLMAACGVSVVVVALVSPLAGCIVLFVCSGWGRRLEKNKRCFSVR